ncbi:hypothetical protein EVAR_88837_1 [Eumeta japonica]|uniref:Uncharacterized protein n=1 Tax=Eumeta variegata TaxID=151549 RepID=A0A4C1Y5P2_EUMVA|nr:hypothetical protein EVAR_88837_1 [Eumeta japonica]
MRLPNKILFHCAVILGSTDVRQYAAGVLDFELQGRCTDPCAKGDYLPSRIYLRTVIVTPSPRVTPHNLISDRKARNLSRPRWLSGVRELLTTVTADNAVATCRGNGLMRSPRRAAMGFYFNLSQIIGPFECGLGLWVEPFAF